jgi:hypothetical protein
MFLIKNLFNIIKFELKINNFTLNNIIENSLYHFFAGSCRARLIGPIIGPSQAQPNGSEVRPGPRASTTRYLLYWTNFIVLQVDPFSPARMARYRGGCASRCGIFI